MDEDDALDGETWYRDSDGDGFGDAKSATSACAPPKGYVDDATDCDDLDGDIYPGADEYCNELDDDCDVAVDESDALDASNWYLDLDGDGYGDPLYVAVSCLQPTGYVELDTDCDDGDGDISPDAEEICDDVDNDCDTVVDYEHNVPNDYPTIQAAVNQALAGDRICVLTGDYPETVSITRDILLEGQDRDLCTIDAAGGGSALTLWGQGATAEVRGFTLTGGSGGSGAAVFSNNSDTLLADLLITENTSTSDSQCQGSLLYFYGGNPVMEHVEIRENSTSCDMVYGEIFAFYVGSLQISHSSLLGNTIEADGETYAGLMASGCTVTWNNGIIAGNYVVAGDGDGEVRTGALGAAGGALDLSNLTIHGNVVDAGTGHVYAGVLFDSDGQISMINVSISDNSVSGGSMDASVGYGANSFEYCNIYEPDEPAFWGMDDPTGIFANISTDPLFTDVTATNPWDWDLTLQPKSGLIDVGHPKLPDADGSIGDIGAYGGPGSDGW